MFEYLIILRNYCKCLLHRDLSDNTVLSLIFWIHILRYFIIMSCLVFSGKYSWGRGWKLQYRSNELGHELLVKLGDEYLMVQYIILSIFICLKYFIIKKKVKPPLKKNQSEFRYHQITLVHLWIWSGKPSLQCLWEPWRKLRRNPRTRAVTKMPSLLSHEGPKC